MIQAKADTFDGLDPLSMFAAQEASSNKTPASVPMTKKVRTGIMINDWTREYYVSLIPVLWNKWTIFSCK